MKMENVTLLISTCEKYSDLWDENIRLLNKNWADRSMRTILVTDCNHSNQYDMVEIFSAGDHVEMPQRILACLSTVETEYVIYCQDDYFLTQRISNSKIKELIQNMQDIKLDYLRLYSYPKANKKIDGYNELKWLNLDRTYDVNMYPGIWKTSFLKNAFNLNVDIWHLEVSLTSFAVSNEARCAMVNANIFPFLDVVEKGKLHYKAWKYLKKQGIELNRDKMTFFEELKHSILFHSRSLMPKKLFILIKRVLKKRGKRFFSDMY